MTQVNGRPEGMPWLSPYITVSNVTNAIDFYYDAFGFSVIDSTNDELGEPMHAELNYKDQVLMLGKEGAYDNPAKTPLNSGTSSPIGLYLYCEDVDQFYAAAIKAGAEGVMAPSDTYWGDRMCRLRDPNGYVWAFATHRGEYVELQEK